MLKRSEEHHFFSLLFLENFPCKFDQFVMYLDMIAIHQLPLNGCFTKSLLWATLKYSCIWFIKFNSAFNCNTAMLLKKCSVRKNGRWVVGWKHFLVFGSKTSSLRVCVWESQQGGTACLSSCDGSQLQTWPTKSCSLTITEEVISPLSKNICYLLHTQNEAY